MGKLTRNLYNATCWNCSFSNNIDINELVETKYTKCTNCNKNIVEIYSHLEIPRYRVYLECRKCNSVNEIKEDNIHFYKCIKCKTDFSVKRKKENNSLIYSKLTESFFNLIGLLFLIGPIIAVGIYIAKQDPENDPRNTRGTTRADLCESQATSEASFAWCMSSFGDDYDQDIGTGGSGYHNVRPYTRSDGTQVNGYIRSNPDSSKSNNINGK
ncbi:hypothetical protein [Paenibacillus sp. V4I7]|uniref:hypothetical protein n=1 Tax=Paenibacillus sp. V4I7 TaxID=3042307 RepID=UPI0027853DDD|nr:hypothetical protein [Paenibacillus sp. V4I7]MDQ0902746.1 DNA-directed RNA polymerase subunit RPC12/RpoP [Paenibacillus sp. V4I7]